MKNYQKFFKTKKLIEIIYQVHGNNLLLKETTKTKREVFIQFFGILKANKCHILK